MRYVATYNTDIGLTKKTNQDSLAIKIMGCENNTAALCIVCDGMGGLSKGELASKELINAFCEWFDRDFKECIATGVIDEMKLTTEWNDIIQRTNVKLGTYGLDNNIQIGTTCSCILLFNETYYIVHVGDSRIYRLDNGVTQLTKDQSFVAREVELGRLTPEQAITDPRRSILLQCVGASPEVVPEFRKGVVTPNTTYMVCSDGFVHNITEQEMLEKIGPMVEADEEKLRFGCIHLTELVKARKESDNITVALVRTLPD